MSKGRIVYSRLELKFWTENVPAVEAARPSECPGCGAASRCPGRPLTIVGHGIRERQLRGPTAVGAAAVELVIRVRRFRCRKCGAVMMVVPPQVLRYRLFSTVAIAWALTLFGITRISSTGVRDRISPWRQVGATAARNWQTLGRWIAAAKAGELLPNRALGELMPRAVATAVAYGLSALAPPSTRAQSLAHQAVSGALHALMGITP